MKHQYILIAQGCGYYGSAIGTTNMSVEQIEQAHAEQDLPPVLHFDMVTDPKHLLPGVVASIMMKTDVGAKDNTMIFMKRWGQGPIVNQILFDSGHGDEDLWCIRAIQGLVTCSCGYTKGQ